MTDLGLIAAISIFTAGLTVSFGAIGPALGRRARRLHRAERDRAATRRRLDHLAHAVRQPCDDRIHGDLLLCRRDDPDLCQPVLERRRRRRHKATGS